MAISVNPLTHVIYVPQADLTFLGGTLYQLDMNTFKSWLKDWEDSEEGIIQLKTNDHNTEVSLSGITYARIIEILDPYTVEFEDGQYTVSCTGANHNLADVKVANQVSLLVNNAAGLISNSAIEYSSFQDRVTLDDTSSYSGTVYPVGTPQQPVNNLADAKQIATNRGLTQIHFANDHTFTSGDNVSLYTLSADDHASVTLTFESGAITAGTKFKECTVTGYLVSPQSFDNCFIVDVVGNTIGQAGTMAIEHCIFSGSVTLSDQLVGEIHLIDCISGVAGTNTPTFDVNGANVNVLVRNYAGGMRISNWNSPAQNVCSIDLNSGQVKLDQTCTSGSITVRGVGKVIDGTTGVHLLSTPTLNGGCSFLNETMSPYQLSTTTWEKIHIHQDDGSSGTEYPKGTLRDPVNNLADAMTISARENIHTLHIWGEFTLDTNYDDIIFQGNSYETAKIILDPACSVNHTVFEYVRISGSCGSGEIIATGCNLPDGLTNVYGHFENCIMDGTFSIQPTGYIRGDRCTATSTAGAIFDMTGSAGSLGQANWGGIMSITNATNPLNLVTVTGTYIANIMPSCTAGVGLAGGIGILNDYSTMSITDKTIPQSVWEEATGQKVDELHLIAGLTSGSAMTVTTSARTAGAITQAITGDGTTTTTVTRQ